MSLQHLRFQYTSSQSHTAPCGCRRPLLISTIPRFLQITYICTSFSQIIADPPRAMNAVVADT
eukprot:31471-Pelagococcus_subviridis.AAC.30